MSDIDAKIRAAVGELADYTYSGDLAAYRAIWAACFADTVERACAGIGDCCHECDACIDIIRALTPPACS